MQAVLTSAGSREPRRVRARAWLLLGLLLPVGCATQRAQRGEVVVSSAWDGPPEEQPLGRTLARWQGLTSTTEPPPAGLELASHAIAQGDIDGAFEALELAHAARPEDPVLVAARAHLEVSLGFLRAAETDFEAAIELDPENPRLWSDLGRVRLDLRLFTRASRAIEQAIALGLDDAEHHVLLALACRGAGRDEDALEAWLEALRRARQCEGVAFLSEVVSLSSARPGDVGPGSIVERPLAFLAASLALDPACDPARLDPLVLSAWDALRRFLAGR